MSERVQLIGAEDVRSASHTIARAAEDMKQAAMNFDGSLERHQRFLEDWLQRFEAVTDKMLATKAPKCKCGVSDPAEKHPCPYRVSNGGDTLTMCTCCDACQEQCASEIP